MRNDTFRVRQVITYELIHSYSEDRQAGSEVIGQFRTLQQATKIAEILLVATPGASLITPVVRLAPEVEMQDPLFPC